jgi:chlorophyll synthase
MLGPKRAAQTAAWTMVVPQLVVVGLLFSWGLAWAGVAVSGLIAVQLLMLRRLLAQPDEARALWYSAVGIPVYVTGMMVTAFAL